jgi:hypothetical protein
MTNVILQCNEAQLERFFLWYVAVAVQHTIEQDYSMRSILIPADNNNDGRACIIQNKT